MRSASFQVAIHGYGSRRASARADAGRLRFPAMSLRCVYTDLDGTLLGRYGSLFRDAEGNFSLLQARASRPATVPRSRS